MSVYNQVKELKELGKDFNEICRIVSRTHADFSYVELLTIYNTY